jgi:outer membrane protein OmpA-like peptidoglycan-associated protein
VNRAYKVASALIKRGVPAEAIRLVAWGETRPPADQGQRSAEAASRRVEIRSLTSY